MNGLDWQTIQIPFTGGLNSKAHEYALDPPGLLICQNVEFDEVGGLRMRKPYASIGASIHPSGSLSDIRKLAVVGDELCVFTKDTLYAWSETLSKWVSRGTHLAVATAETVRFSNPNDQTFADRAQLSGVIVYVWSETSQGGTVLCYLAAIDATTGAPIISPTSFTAGRTKPRVVAVDTRILVFWVTAGTGVEAAAINPSSPTFTTTGATLVDTNEQPYDVVRDPAADAAVLAIANTGAPQYVVARITAALAVSSTSKGRASDGIIAVACSADGNTMIMRTSGNNVRGDRLTTSSLADTASLDTAIGGAAAAISHLTGAFRSTQDGGFYRCYVFWSASESSDGATARQLESNWIDTNAATGTEATFLLRSGIAARAFNYNGQIYLWSVFAGLSDVATGGGMSKLIGLRGQQQNTYYLHRDDGELVAKAAWSRAGGFQPTAGHLPGVALVSGTTGFAWAGIERQIITLGGTDNAGYGARAPRDIVLTFDSDDARRTIVLGRTMYVSGGLLLQYDGEGLAEVGFEQYPWFFDGATPATGTSLGAGAYSYKATWRWANARGESERSTSAIGMQVTAVAGDQVDIEVTSLHVTRKQGIRRDPALEIWRTKANPVADSPFYLTNSKDPSTAAPNEYRENDPTVSYSTSTYTDVMVDATLETKEQHPENGGTLPRLAAPPATILAASDTRLFLAGVPGEINRVHYSFLRDEHEIAAFNGALSFALPTHTGAITGLAFLNETLVAFTATAVYAIPGDGFNNVGGGANYGPPRLLSSDLGALSHDSIALTPGGLVFFSRKGWYRLNSGWSLEYIGARVEAFNTDSGGFVAAQVVEAQHQVRFLSASRMLVWDYLVNEWSEWVEGGGRDLAIWSTSPMLLDTDGVKKQQTTFTAATYAITIETGWIKLAGMQGFGRVRSVELLGEFKADHRQNVQMARDYKTSFFFSKNLSVDLTTVGDPIQTKHGVTQQRLEALKVRITIADTLGNVPNYDAITLTGLALEVGLYRGLYRRLPVAQKQ